MERQKPSGIITLTTDFGLADHYVGVMKGVILSACASAKVVDLSHGVEPHQVEQGAFFLAQGYPYFPEGTVHAAVVDPGVGTLRRLLIAEANGHYFVGPDNGVLSHALEGADARVYAAEAAADASLGRTFHGRDFFAPLAARIVCLGGLEDWGDSVDDYVRLPSLEPERRSSGRWRGRVLNVDRFGNLVTSLTPELLESLGEGFLLRIGDAEIGRLAQTYEEIDDDDPFLIVGSAGFIEVSVRESSAASTVDAWFGDEVELEADPLS